MSGPLRFDELMALAFEDVRSLEPSAADVARAVRAAGEQRRRRLVGWRRRLAVTLVVLLGVGGTAMAIPQTRDAVLGGFDRFRDFVLGDGSPPGTPIGDPTGTVLDWFEGSNAVDGAVVARSGDARLVAYRQVDTGFACLAYGGAIAVCNEDAHWTRLLDGASAGAFGTTPEADAAGRIPFMGIVADTVSAVELRYADGATVRADGLRHGFVMHVDGDRSPRTLVTFGADGARIEEIDVAGVQWDYGP